VILDSSVRLGTSTRKAARSGDLPVDAFPQYRPIAHRRISSIGRGGAAGRRGRVQSGCRRLTYPSIFNEQKADVFITSNEEQAG
jgi:hypothetical protein